MRKAIGSSAHTPPGGENCGQWDIVKRLRLLRVQRICPHSNQALLTSRETLPFRMLLDLDYAEASREPGLCARLHLVAFSRPHCFVRDGAAIARRDTITSKRTAARSVNLFFQFFSFIIFQVGRREGAKPEPQTSLGFGEGRVITFSPPSPPSRTQVRTGGRRVLVVKDTAKCVA